MEETSKTQMELAIRSLERRAHVIKDVPTFKGIPATDFDKEHLVMLCKLFANEWHKAQTLYFEALRGHITTYKASAAEICMASYRSLERRAHVIKDVPAFKGIPATDFDKEHLVMLCKLFANEWHKAQTLYFEALRGHITTYKARAAEICTASYKPSLWRRIWNKIKKV